ncbi:MAG: SIR2 family protein [Candidatus Competibacteraceae bacterium]|nr:SIR2 family protein [Candidatus Competibacteraceae bacterium]
MPKILEYRKTLKCVDGEILTNLVKTLMDSLVDLFIDICATATVEKSAQIAQLNCFLAELEKEFDIGIITLNYDNIFTQAYPNLYTGFTPITGMFNPLSVLSREEWGFIYHLHGSIHFAMTGTAQDTHGITWTATPTKGASVHALGRDIQDSMEGIAYPTSIIVAGYGKTPNSTPTLPNLLRTNKSIDPRSG